METSEKIKVLRAFCATPSTDSRTVLHNPFTKDGYTWASNGHSMVRFEKIDEIAEGGDSVNVSKVFQDFFCEENMRKFKNDVPDIEEEKTECEECEGRGTEHDCPCCTCECEACGGTGYVTQKTSICIDVVPFNARYIKTLSSLPGVMIQDHPSPTRAMSFTFDGGCGLLMPMRAKYEQHIEVEL